MYSYSLEAENRTGRLPFGIEDVDQTERRIAYDAKYIDSRDGSIKSGQELANGRIKRNHKLDGENLHPYR